MTARPDSAVLDLGDLPALLADATLPPELATAGRQETPCPYCGDPLPGLLALCWGTASDGRPCRSHALDADRTFERSHESD
ncbi:hypothetical protein [Polymorphospora lycopeni]|uniref:Uncharacterized protein n=1 Tax=Polymorphospora lycopeni TaxID=3140240 RepID=A0ABV5CKP2_9ACTN